MPRASSMEAATFSCRDLVQTANQCDPAEPSIGSPCTALAPCAVERNGEPSSILRALDIASPFRSQNVFLVQELFSIVIRNSKYNFGVPSYNANCSVHLICQNCNTGASKRGFLPYRANHRSMNESCPSIVLQQTPVIDIHLCNRMLGAGAGYNKTWRVRWSSSNMP